jgi:hypothetical protein
MNESPGTDDNKWRLNIDRDSLQRRSWQDECRRDLSGATVDNPEG